MAAGNFFGGEFFGGGFFGARYAPVVGPVDWRDVDDRAFEAFARITALEADIEDIERFIDEVEAAGDEFVDPWDNSIDHDSLGAKRRGRRLTI